MQIFTAFFSANVNAFGFGTCEGFFCALTDEIALDFGAETKGKGEDFTGNVGAKAIVVLDGPKLDFLFHALAEDVHNHEKASSKA